MLEGITRGYFERIRKVARRFILWNGQLHRRKTLSLKVVPPLIERQLVLEAFHNDAGYWGPSTTGKFVRDWFWWPSLTTDFTPFDKSCAGFRRAKHTSKYHITLGMPLKFLCGTFSIYFAKQLPTGPDGEKYLLIAVENLTGRSFVQWTIRYIRCDQRISEKGYYYCFWLTSSYDLWQGLMFPCSCFADSCD